MGHTYSNHFFLFIWNSNLPGPPVFLFAKCGNSNFEGVFPEAQGYSDLRVCVCVCVCACVLMCAFEGVVGAS